MQWVGKLYFVAVLLSISPLSNIFAQTGSSLTFSEIMFNPSETNGEFVEIYNTSTTETVDLTNYKFKYYTSSNNNIITLSGGMQLGPGKFAVILQGNYDFANGIYKTLIPADAIVLKISSNSFGSSGMANTTSRDLYLLNSSDEIVDAYTYSANNDTGISDEKIILDKNNASSNWTNSIDVNGTPGFKKAPVIMPNYSFRSLVINEIMFDPDTDNAEYLEFYNTTSDSMQIDGLELRIGTSVKIKLANSNLLLPPHNYFVLADDSSIYRNYTWLKNETKVGIIKSMTLSNEGTMLVVKDSHGNTLDSVSYSPDWHNKNILTTKNRSLERLNPLLGSNVRSNWNTSVNAEGGSPGKQNSIYSENTSRESKVVISPNPFSPDNDGYEDYAIINFDLAQPFSQVRIKVFDSQGRLVRSIAENKLAASKNSVIFDGLDDNGRPLRIGIYILLIEAIAEGSGNVEVIKTPVVVARKL
ncbi:MAG: hypothetical protein D4R68_06875 [Ignavibacteriales bacterium]|nr:MAG: hypothetical protein D4R68_06875 [Ignavibacteriales bacterium]